MYGVLKLQKVYLFLSLFCHLLSNAFARELSAMGSAPPTITEKNCPDQTGKVGYPVQSGRQLLAYGVYQRHFPAILFLNKLIEMLLGSRSSS